MPKTAPLAFGLAALLAAAGAQAQGSRASPPLPELPAVYRSSDYDLLVVEVASGLENPWSIAFLPNGDALVTERPGRLRLLRDGALAPEPIAGVPEVHVTFLGGLLDVELHPDYADNQLVYLSYSKRLDAERATTAVARGRFDDEALTGVEEIFVANTASTSPTNFGGRMVFGDDGKLYLTVGERQEPERAQDTADHGGKVLRLDADGGVPDDNPFVGRADHAPEIFTLGHRSPQGLAVHPGTGEIWENEHGPLGGDEINVLEAGANYGWPLVTYGTDYDGTPVSEDTSRPGLGEPFMYWVPSIAISGLSFYTGDVFSEWHGNAFVGGLMEGRIRWTGHVQRITFNDSGRPITREPILTELRQRIRGVWPGPDGLLWVLTDENPGAVLRVEPAER